MASSADPQPQPAPASPPAADPARPGFSAGEWFYLAVVVIYALVTRLWRLDLKPIQHDESMFAYYAYMYSIGRGYIYMDILHGPVLELWGGHLFNLLGDSDYTMRLLPALSGLGLMAVVFAMRNWMGRRAMWFALGFIAISPTLTFFSRFCRNDVMFLFTSTLMVYAGWIYARTRHFAALLAWPAILALSISIEETYVIHTFLLATFALGCLIHGVAKKLPLAEMPVIRVLRHAVVRHWFVIPIGLALGCLIIVALFTSYFENMDKKFGPITAIEYWTGQHKEHRIFGHFHYHLLTMSIYELPFMLFFVICVCAQLWTCAPDRRLVMKRVLFVLWLGVSWIALILPVGVNGTPLWRAEFSDHVLDVYHIKYGFHVWMIVQLFIAIGISGWKHLNRGRFFHAFSDYLAAGSFFAYAYAGEKVPWVAVHIVLPLLISCALYADLILKGELLPKSLVDPDSEFAKEERRREAERAALRVNAPGPLGQLLAILAALFLGSAALGRGGRRRPSEESAAAKRKKAERAPAASASATAPADPAAGSPFLSGLVRNAWLIPAGIGLGWEVWLAWFVCFYNCGNPIEKHTYAASHSEFHAEIQKVIKECDEKFQGKQTPITVIGSCDWPLYWSLRRFERANMNGGYRPGEPFVILEQRAMEGQAPYGDGKIPYYYEFYDWTRVRFRHYWQPVPLDWQSMKQVGLLLRDPEKLDPAARQTREACKNNWGKLWTALILRDENIQGPTRWEHLGGLDAYVGRLKTGPAATSPPAPPAPPPAQ